MGQITEFTDRYNKTSTPFVWVAPAQSILDKVERTIYAYLRDTTLAWAHA